MNVNYDKIRAEFAEGKPTAWATLIENIRAAAEHRGNSGETVRAIRRCLEAMDKGKQLRMKKLDFDLEEDDPQ